MKLVSKRRQRRKERQAEILRAREEQEAEDNLMRIFAEEPSQRVYIRDIIGCDQGLDIPPATLPGGTHPAMKVLLDYRQRRSIPWPPTAEEAEKLAKLAEEAPRVTIKEYA